MPAFEFEVRRPLPTKEGCVCAMHVQSFRVLQFRLMGAHVLKGAPVERARV